MTAALGLAATAGACGIGDKQQKADRIHASRGEVAEASPATGTVTFELEADGDAPGGLVGEEQAQLTAAVAGAAGASNALTVQIALDGRDRRAKVSIADPAVERATVFADTKILVRRQNARATERRTWAKLDLGRIVEDERPLALGEMSPSAVLGAVASTVNPVYLVELVEGTLAGSVEIVGNENIGDVATTRYDANISFDKAMTELDFDDEDREVRLRLFRLLGATKDVVPARIWLDDEGRLRRFRLELEQRRTRQQSTTLIITTELTTFGADAVLDGPAPESIVTYERFGRLVRAALPAEA